MDIANPPEAYFEAMRRLRPEPPDEETVERIVEIYRAWCRKQEERVSPPASCQASLADRGPENQG